MICDKHNEIVKRKKNGNRCTIIRCADPDCIHFTKKVTEEQCKNCPRHALSKVEVPKIPGLLRRGTNYTKALAGWVVAGRPERSDEEVQRIYHQFCAGRPPCRWFDQKRQVCLGCGCNVTVDGPAVLNKIKMATQHCPRQLW